MNSSFNPYMEWLGRTNPRVPQNHYELLDLPLHESNPQTIFYAANAIIIRLSGINPGANYARWQELMGQVQEALQCLTNPTLKAQYDASLPGNVTGSPLATPPGIPSPSSSIPGISPSSSAGASSYFNGSAYYDRGVSHPSGTSPASAVSESPYPPTHHGAYSSVAVPPGMENTTRTPCTSYSGGNNYTSPASNYVTPPSSSISSTPSPGETRALPPGMSENKTPYAFSPGTSYHTSPNAPVETSPSTPGPLYAAGIYAPSNTYTTPETPNMPTSMGPNQATSPGPLSAPINSGNASQQTPNYTPSTTYTPQGYTPSADNLQHGVVLQTSAPKNTTPQPISPVITGTESLRTSASSYHRRKKSGGLLKFLCVLMGIAILGMVSWILYIQFGLPGYIAQNNTPPETTVNVIDNRGPDAPPINTEAVVNAARNPSVTEKDLRQAAVSPKKENEPSVNEKATKQQESAVPPTAPVSNVAADHNTKKTEPDRISAQPEAPAPTMEPQANPADTAKFRKIIQEIRTALGVQDIFTARKKLKEAEKIPVSPEDQKLFTRMDTLTNYMESFIRWMGNTMGRFEAATDVDYEGTMIAIVESAPGRLMVKTSGQMRTYTINNLNPKLVKFLVGKNTSSADNQLAYGTYLAMTPGADRNLARKLWNDAKNKGRDVSLIMPELDEALAPAGKKMGSGNSNQRFSGPVKTEVPSGATLESAKKNIQNQFKSVLASAKDERSQDMAAERLFKAAQAKNIHPEERYALLEETLRLARASHRVKWAYGALHAMQMLYETETYAERMELLTKPAPDSLTPVKLKQYHYEVAFYALDLCTLAVDLGETKDAKKLMEIIQANIKSISTPKALRQIKELKSKIDKM